MYRILLILFSITAEFSSSQVPGSLDVSFNAGIGANNPIFTMSEQQDKKIIIGGSFTIYDGSNVVAIARIFPDGKLDSSFHSPFYVCDFGGQCQTIVRKIIIQSDGKIVVGGDLYLANTPEIPNSILKLNQDGSVDLTFNNYIPSFKCMEKQADEKIILSTKVYNNIHVKGLVRILPDGQVDSTFNVFTSGIDSISSIGLIRVQMDGKILIGGSFSEYKGVSCPKFTRLNNDGTLDNEFNSNLGQGSINGCYPFILPDGKLLVTGEFSEFNGIPANRIARLTSNGVFDNTFNIGGTGISNGDASPTLYINGLLLLASNYSQTIYNGILVDRLFRIYENGEIDETFNPGTAQNNSITSWILQNENSLLLGGAFTTYNGENHKSICRIFINNITSINEFRNIELKSEIFPNPVESLMTITANKNAIYTITNALGVQVKRFEVFSGANYIDVSSLSNGTYYLKAKQINEKFFVVK
jgi:uncharacterized delta-60 repeat protein